MNFTKATKTKAKLRAAIFGPAGAGKTYTSLSIATGMGGKIALIDSERGSANKYADRFDFDIAELDVKNIDAYVEVINQAVGCYDVLIIDSLSHAWNELLEEVEKIAKAKYRGNTWSAWSEGNPKQKKLVDALLSFPGHIIATMRSKTEWQTSTENGKIKPTRVGLSPEQGKGIEYEFDLLIELNTDHMGNIIKDRTGKFQDVIIDKPSVDFGKQLVEWLNTGEDMKPYPKKQPESQPELPVETPEQKQASPEAHILSEGEVIGAWFWRLTADQRKEYIPEGCKYAKVSGSWTIIKAA